MSQAQNVDGLFGDMAPQMQAWYCHRGAAMLRKLGIQPGQCVLDFGCGPGRFAAPLARAVAAPNGRVIAVDRKADALDKLRECLTAYGETAEVEIIHADGREVLQRIADGSLDAALLFDVVQHLEKWDELFTELNRVLKPSGRVYVYPSAIPHPGRVDVHKLHLAMKSCGFEAAESLRLLLPHRSSIISDEVHIFTRRSE